MTGIAAGIAVDAVRLKLGSQPFEFDVTIPSGCVTVLCGPSGSGKSTLLNLVAGFERPDSGRIFVGGQDVTDKHPADRPVSLVFQDNNLFSHLDLFTNVGLGVHPAHRLSAEERKAIYSALQRVGLDGFEKRKPPSLSGGERQRAAFARALVRRKPVLLLDEPFAALDPGLRSAMAELLLDLHRETGNTVLIVSHDPKEVAAIADHVLFVSDGRIIFTGSAEELMAARDLPPIERFLGSTRKQGKWLGS